MRLRLQISRHDGTDDYSVGARFRFAVVDWDKAETYPLNFVCMLPLRVGSKENKPSVFASVFGSQGLECAKGLLTEALKSEDDPDIRKEIERRLKLLEPEPVCNKICVSCGKSFQVDSSKRFKQRFCQDCVKKKFGSRD